MTIQLPNSHELSVSLFGFRFCLLCVRFYVNDLICMRSALLALVGVFFLLGYFLSMPLAPEKQTVLVLYIFGCTWCCCIFDPSTVCRSCTIVHSS
jgi:heme/copper-type cytochrome/quinol oxidase subunit 4